MGLVSCNQIFNIHPTDFEMSKKSVTINNQMPKNTLDIIQRNFKSTKDKSVLILGLTYREDVEDTRFSPSLKLIDFFKGKFKKICCHDPMLSSIDLERIYFEKTLPDAKDFDLIVLTVSHQEYKNINYFTWLEKFNGLLIDSNNVLEKTQISNLKKLNLKLKIIGRGDI